MATNTIQSINLILGEEIAVDIPSRLLNTDFINLDSFRYYFV